MRAKGREFAELCCEFAELCRALAELCRGSRGTLQRARGSLPRARGTLLRARGTIPPPDGRFRRRRCFLMQGMYVHGGYGSLACLGWPKLNATEYCGMLAGGAGRRPYMSAERMRLGVRLRARAPPCSTVSQASHGTKVHMCADACVTHKTQRWLRLEAPRCAAWCFESRAVARKIWCIMCARTPHTANMA